MPTALVSSGAFPAQVGQSGTFTSADVLNTVVRGVKVILSVTANAGGLGSVVLKIQGRDVASGSYYDLLTSAALSAVATSVFHAQPEHHRGREPGRQRRLAGGLAGHRLGQRLADELQRRLHDGSVTPFAVKGGELAAFARAPQEGARRPGFRRAWPVAAPTSGTSSTSQGLRRLDKPVERALRRCRVNPWPPKGSSSLSSRG